MYILYAYTIYNCVSVRQPVAAHFVFVPEAVIHLCRLVFVKLHVSGVEFPVKRKIITLGLLDIFHLRIVVSYQIFYKYGSNGYLGDKRLI